MAFPETARLDVARFGDVPNAVKLCAQQNRRWSREVAAHLVVRKLAVARRCGVFSILLTPA